MTGDLVIVRRALRAVSSFEREGWPHEARLITMSEETLNDLAAENGFERSPVHNPEGNTFLGIEMRIDDALDRGVVVVR